MRTKLATFFQRIFHSSINTYALIFILSFLTIIFLTANFYDYDRAFFQNVLVEAHGMLFDVLILGLLVAWLNSKGDRQRLVLRYQEEIDDFRGWDEKEVAYRNAGIIRRLNKLGISEINLYEANLREVNLQNANLEGAELLHAKLSLAIAQGVNFRKANIAEADLTGARMHSAKMIKANLSGANLEKADLLGATLSGAKLTKTNLSGANLSGANLSGANLSEANLEQADLQGVDLRGTKLVGVNFAGVKNITTEQLSKAETLFMVSGLPRSVMEEIEAKYRHLLVENILMSS